MLYAFILGKNPSLSIAEIISVLKRDHFVFVIISISTKSMVIKIDNDIENVQNVLDTLGGTIKIAQVFTQTKEDSVIGPIVGYISNSFKDSKFIYGVSFYGTKNRKLGFEIKNQLKKIGVNSRYVQGKDDHLSAPEIKNNMMLEKGADFVVIKNGAETFVGKTIAIQDYESYSYRDYSRPRRNAKSGMLPPKVAQSMLNLVPEKVKTIYDPFCGNGTILQEAALMGLSIFGSDLLRERVYDTVKNLEWLKKEYNLNTSLEKRIFESNALEIGVDSPHIKADAIVSEVYLGPPMDSRTKERDILETINKLEKDYLVFLKSATNIKTKHLVLAIPFYLIKRRSYFLNIIDEAKKLGYNTISPMEDFGFDFDPMPEYEKNRKTILYARPDQIVGREILILEKS